MSPKQLCNELDKYIIGQQDAKKAISVALRSRWRRRNLPEEVRQDVISKNILMVGPTGCGKTEIARRLAKLCGSPFIKVEATKYTEVGYHGKDVDQMIKDLVSAGINQVKENIKNQTKKYNPQMKDIADNYILQHLLGVDYPDNERKASKLDQLKSGKLDMRFIYFEEPSIEKISNKLQENQSIEEYLSSLNELKISKSLQSYKERITIGEARANLIQSIIEDYTKDQNIIKVALEEVQENGIVFIDEIDKIVTPIDSYKTGTSPSAEGVQRDLLPLIEGTVISTKHGDVVTDHILFIASGAFSDTKPSDLLPELQGRLPIRVTLNALSKQDFFKILKETENNILKQNSEMIKTEGISIIFTDEAIEKIAEISDQINKSIENTGARRLITVTEKILEDISFNAPDFDKEFTITVDYVVSKTESLLKTVDIKKHVM